jgi:ElaB/YqjD/DUF883 family membrane-anchored ribosome-binding protein
MSQSPYPYDPDLTPTGASILIDDPDRTDPVAAEGSTSTGDVAKDQAADLKDSAVDAGQRVADTAKDQAGNVAAEATNQAKDLLKQSREELRDHAAQQQARVADGLHSLSHELTSMASSSTDQGLAADLAREVAGRTHTVASWLDEREPGELLEEVRSFARERPGAFLGIAAAAGVLAGRLGRGLKEGPASPDDSTTGHPAHAATPDPSIDLDGPLTAPDEAAHRYPA